MADSVRVPVLNRLRLRLGPNANCRRWPPSEPALQRTRLLVLWNAAE